MTGIGIRVLIAAVAAAGAMVARAGAAEGSRDERLAAARRYVESSAEYLHHDQLRRGMKGYGVTVLAGSERVRFEVEIVSVVKHWGPHQDVILARLAGQNLENSGIIAGMSGSPCYVEHEGRDKLIGAVAYGWQAQKEPLCGIQPITQMLAAAGVGRPEGATAPAGQAARSAGAPSNAGQLLAAAMNPRDRDFSRLLLPEAEQAGGAGLQPLVTPLMVSGISPKSMGRLGEMLAPLGLVPVQAGGGGSAAEELDEPPSLVAGAAMSVQLADGDADLNAIGTVTAVAEGKIFAFGHPFLREAEIELPMGPAYVHTVVSHLLRSFKIASSLAPTGALIRDEAVAVVARVGEVPEMIPMTVEVTWPAGSDGPASTQRFVYRVARHRVWTPVLASMLAQDAAWGWRDAPQEHTVRHWATVDFGEAGMYEAADVAAGAGPLAAVADISRPLATLLNTSLGEPPEVKRIALRLEVQRGDISAEIVQLRLNGRVYRPGETVVGWVTVRPYRADRREVPVEFVLPDDLPDGKYSLTACGSQSALQMLRSERPQLFDPRTVPQALAAIQRIAATPDGKLYLRLPLKDGGLALGHRELPLLPPSRAAILSEASLPDTRAYTRAVVRSVDSEYALSGSADAAFEVHRKVSEILTRQED